MSEPEEPTYMVSKITYTIVDEKGQTSRLSVHVRHLGLVEIIEWMENPVDFAQYLGVALDYHISGRITGINLSIPVPLPSGIKLLEESTSDVEEGLEIVYVTYDKTRWKHRIPTFKQELILPDGDVDWSFELEHDFIEMMFIPEDLAHNWSVHPTDSRGVPLGGPILYKKSFKPR